MLNNIFSASANQIEITTILLCSLTSIVLGIMIAFTHKKTSKYSKNFLITLSILPLLVQTVIILVNGNLGTSVAIVGAFSLVRFRSMPGTSKEILSVFFAMSIGLATGIGYLFFAVLITVITCFMIWILSIVKIYNQSEQEKILKIVIPENLDYTEIFDDIFKKYTQKVTLEQVKTINMGSMFDLRYHIILMKNINEKEFIDELRVKNGNLKIILTHPLEESDL